MGENVEAALKDAERVAKKQKLCATKTSEVINNLCRDIQNLQSRAAGLSSAESAGLVQQLVDTSNEVDIISQISTHTKDLHGAVSKLGKALDKAFVRDISKAVREDVQFEQETLNYVIAQHLFHEGRSEVGELFVKEADVVEGDALKGSFRAMHEVLKEIQAHNLTPALRWVDSHRQELVAAGASTSFEFQLHRLQFMHVLQNEGQNAALQYARSHFDPFKHTQMHEIQRLMGCLLYVKRLGRSPYADLLSPTQWDDMAHAFARQCCELLGQAYRSPLLVAVAAGSIAIPTLLKMASVLEKQANGVAADLTSPDQLPCEVELGKEFVFHSIFACPVSRDQSTPDNPPMMLPCGHVLCKHSINKIAKTSTRQFKCPYCPAEGTLVACKQIYFPNIVAA